MKNFFRKLILSILTIFLFLSATLLLLILPISNNLNRNNIEKIIESFEIEQLTKNTPEIESTINEVIKPIYEENQITGIDYDTLLTSINSKDIKNLTSDVTNNMIEYILTGKDQDLISKNQLEKLLSDIINSQTQYQLTDIEKTKILESVHEKSNEYMQLIPKTSIIENSLTSDEKEALKALQFILGGKLKSYLIISIIICIIGIIIFKSKKLNAIKSISITILASGISSLLTTLITGQINKIVFESEIYIYNIIDAIIKNSLFISISTIISMIILLIICNIAITKISKTKKSNQAENPLP